jgi:hypothetical protein
MGKGKGKGKGKRVRVRIRVRVRVRVTMNWVRNPLNCPNALNPSLAEISDCCEQGTNTFPIGCYSVYCIPIGGHLAGLSNWLLFCMLHPYWLTTRAGLSRRKCKRDILGSNRVRASRTGAKR